MEAVIRLYGVFVIVVSLLSPWAAGSLGAFAVGFAAGSAALFGLAMVVTGQLNLFDRR